jgi:hypothetical protein
MGEKPEIRRWSCSFGLQAQPEPQCAVEFLLIGNGKPTKSPVDARLVEREQSSLDDTRKQQPGFFPLNQGEFT